MSVAPLLYSPELCRGFADDVDGLAPRRRSGSSFRMVMTEPLLLELLLHLLDGCPVSNPQCNNA